MQIYRWYPILFIVILISILHCKSIPFHPGKYQNDYLVIGDGGGYTGLETSYYFTSKGHVYRQTGRDTVYVSLPGIDRRTVTQAILNVQQLDLLNYEYNDPGNVYKFLDMAVGGKHNRIVWGGSRNELNPAVTTLYQILNESLQKEK